MDYGLLVGPFMWDMGMGHERSNKEPNGDSPILEGKPVAMVSTSKAYSLLLKVRT